MNNHRVERRCKTKMENQRKKKTGFFVILFLLLLFSAAVIYFVGRPLIQYISEPEEFRNYIAEHGIVGRLFFIFMVVFQVVIAVVPGEPFELAAGYAFGIWEGTLLSIIGIALGSLLVFFVVRRFGVPFIEQFFSLKKIESIKFLKKRKNLNLIFFILFFLPGTPKDFLTYVVGLTKMSPKAFAAIVIFARFPSVVTSAIAGDALVSQNYLLTVLVYAVTGLLCLAGVGIYRKFFNETPSDDDTEQ